MPTTMDRFKTAFATDGRRRALFDRRKVKAIGHLDEAGSLIGDLQDRGVDVTAFQGRLTPLENQYWETLSLGDEHPGAAYRAMGDIKDAGKALTADLHKALGKELGSTADDGSTRQIKMIVGDVFRGVLAHGYKDPNGWLEGPTLEVEVWVEVPLKIYHTVAADPLFHQQLSDAASIVYKKHVADGTKLLEKLDKVCKSKGFRAPESMEAAEAVDAWAAGVPAAIVPEVKTAVEGAVAKYKKTKKEYKDYQVATTAKIATSVLILTVGIVSLAATPFSFGATAVIAIWALAKGAINLGKQIADAAVGADTQYGFAVSRFKVMTKRYTHVSKTQGTAMEVGGQALKFAFGTDFFQGIKPTLEEIKLARNKYHGVEVDCHDLARTVAEMIDKISWLERECKARASDDPRIPEMGAKVAKIGEKLTPLLEEIPAEITKANHHRAWCEVATATLLVIKKEHTNETFTTVTEWGFKIADLAVGATGGAVSPDFTALQFALEQSAALIGAINNELADRLDA